MSEIKEVKEILRKFLEKRGFSVWLDKTLAGFSGIEYTFDLVAVREDAVLCFILAGEDGNAILRSTLRAMDFEHAKVFLLLSEVRVDRVPEYLKKVKGLRVVLFKNVEDLLKKIDSAIAETD